MAINQIYYGNTELINLQNDTITAADVCNQKTFHLRDGTRATGTNNYDANTSDANAEANNILLNKTAYVNGNKIIGTMPNNGSMTAGLSTKTATKIIPAGYTSGGTVSISTAEQNKIISGNIKTGISILGVNGTFTNDATATPADILGGNSPKTAYVNGNKITGTMPDYASYIGLWETVYMSGAVTTQSRSKTLTLPVVTNLNGRPILWIQIYCGVNLNSSYAYILSLSYTKNPMLKISGAAQGQFVSTTTSKASVFGKSYFSLEDENLLASGGTKIVISNSIGATWAPATYYISIGG